MINVNPHDYEGYDTPRLYRSIGGDAVGAKRQVGRVSTSSQRWVAGGR